MQNSLVKHQMQQPYNPLVYSDDDVNGLLDTISRLQLDNLFLLREHQRMIMICQAMRVDILCLRSANEAQRKQIDQLLQQNYPTK
ncbi:hypothetical protein HMF3257_21010 [Spirosoma telluris]|uniref:Uncharacterized protein n=1 Tax=Spirosoma telluris TaxID=2183553 RepID=A0A327NMM7_9BACT|nr:hypothetical protein HMF3257_21010 [Spirosoma telluris]